jgi:hypothetical protein
LCNRTISASISQAYEAVADFVVGTEFDKKWLLQTAILEFLMQEGVEITDLLPIDLRMILFGLYQLALAVFC